jgi:hypothetical protein
VQAAKRRPAELNQSATSKQGMTMTDGDTPHPHTVDVSMEEFCLVITASEHGDLHKLELPLIKIPDNWPIEAVAAVIALGALKAVDDRWSRQEFVHYLIQAITLLSQRDLENQKPEGSA